MPWDLHFPTDTLDARVEYRGIMARLREHPEVASVGELGRAFRHTPTGHTGTTLLRVFLRGERGDEDAPAVQDRWLQRIHDQYDAPPRREPPPTMEGTFLQVPYRYGDGEPNQNGDVFPRPNLPDLGLTPEVRDGIISRFLQSSEGRSRLAQSMVAPIRRNLDYMGTARAAFLVEELPPGALPVFDHDPNMARMALTPDPVVVPEWVQPGQWVRSKDCRHVGNIENLTGPDHSYRYVRVSYWREERPEDVVALGSFVTLWEPCDVPMEPRPLWERLLGEDDL